MTQFDDIPDKDYPYSGRHMNILPQYQIVYFDTGPRLIPIDGPIAATATLPPAIRVEYLPVNIAFGTDTLSETK